MAVSSHLDQLRRKHEALHREIEEEQQHPASDFVAIKKLKRRKLHLKEEIEKLARLH